MNSNIQVLELQNFILVTNLHKVEINLEMMKDLMADLPLEERKKLSARLMKPFGKSHEAIYKVPHDHPKPQPE